MNFTTKKISLTSQNENMNGTLYLPEVSISKTKKLPAIAIFHGYHSQESRYTDRAEAYAQAGFIALVFSFRGHGTSDRNLSNTTVSMNYDDAVVAYDFLCKQDAVDTNRIGVYGSSFGAYFAALLTAERTIHSLVLDAPTISSDDWIDRIVQTLSDKEKHSFRSGTDFSDNTVIQAISKFTENLLLVEHEIDTNCPKNLTMPYYEHATKAVRKEKMMIDGVGHRLVEPKHRKESNEITTQWFRETL